MMGGRSLRVSFKQRSNRPSSFSCRWKPGHYINRPGPKHKRCVTTQDTILWPSFKLVRDLRYAKHHPASLHFLLGPQTQVYHVTVHRNHNGCIRSWLPSCDAARRCSCDDSKSEGFCCPLVATWKYYRWQLCGGSASCVSLYLVELQWGQVISAHGLLLGVTALL